MRPAFIIALIIALAGCGQGGNSNAPGNGAVTLELPPATPYNLAEGNAVLSNEAETTNEAASNESAPAEEPAAETDETIPQDDAKSEAPANVAEPKSAPQPPLAEGEPKLLPTRMPLSDAEITRAIERIGFDCGQVVSSNRVDNPGGDFIYKINCSSGKSYQGTMRDGRLRFREWTGRLTRD